MISLKKRLRIDFTVLAVIMIILFLGSTYLVVKSSFETYKLENQVKRDEEIVRSLSREIQKDESISANYLNNLKKKAIDGNYELIIYDLNRDVIWNMEQGGNSNMRGMHRMMNNWSGEISYEEYEIIVDGQTMAYLDIGMYQSFFMTTEDVKFIDSLAKGFGVVTLISILIAMAMGSFLSKKLAKPIVGIKNTTNVIKDGDLTARNHTDSNISELVELSSSINELAVNLSAQENLRIRLTRDVSHELRTPLHVMKAHIEALIDGIWEATPGRLSAINEEVNRLSDLIKNLEKLADLTEEEKLDIKEENLTNLMENVLMQYETILEVNKIKLIKDIQSDVFFKVDSHKIKQVVYNLLSNAVKYTGEDGVVEVKLFSSDNEVVITVEDNGIGIDKEEQQHVFERFYRTDSSRNSRTGGAGLGLSITKKIVELHGGKISLESTKNMGSKFVVKFPIKR